MELDELKALLYVAETGSFMAAAAKLNWPRSTLRRKVESLESQAGVTLLLRTQRGVMVTDAGAVLVARGRVMMEESRALLASIRDGAGQATGTLRLSIPAGMPPHLAPGMWSLMRAAHPLLHFEVTVAASPLSDQLSEFDLALAFSIDDPPGPYIVRKLMTVKQRVLANQDYLSRHGAPRSIRDLADGHLLMAWTAPGDSGGSPMHQVRPLLRSNDIHMLRLFAVSGQGIAYVPDAEGASENDGLVQLLEAEAARDVGLYLVVPSALAEVPKIKSVLTQFFGFIDSMRK